MTGLPPPNELRRLLYTPVLSDVLDSFGLMHQALRPFVRPLDETLVLFGRVRTGRYMPSEHGRRATIPRARNGPDRRPEAGRSGGAGLRRPHRLHRALG